MQRGREVVTAKMDADRVANCGPTKIMLQRYGLTMPLKEVVLVNGPVRMEQVGRASLAAI